MAAPGVSQPFSLSFTLAENMEVSGATFNNGLLHIDLTRNEPEVVIPQRIAISERPASTANDATDKAPIIGAFFRYKGRPAVSPIPGPPIIVRQAAYRPGGLSHNP
jgi:hypothetical protein